MGFKEFKGFDKNRWWDTPAPTKLNKINICSQNDFLFRLQVGLIERMKNFRETDFLVYLR